MSTFKRIAAVAAAGVGPSLVPGFVLNSAQPFPWIILFAAASAIGGGLIACAAGGVALFAARGRADRGLRPAVIVALVTGVIVAGAAFYGLRH